MKYLIISVFYTINPIFFWRCQEKELEIYRAIVLLLQLKWISLFAWFFQGGLDTGEILKCMINTMDKYMKGYFPSAVLMIGGVELAVHSIEHSGWSSFNTGLW